MDPREKARSALRAAHRRRLDAEEAELRAVAAARAAGATWQEIGEDLGMAGPNAHRKYAKRLRETRIVDVLPDTGRRR